MPSIRDELAADVAAAIALYDQSFEWHGNPYACVRRDTPTAQELQDAGGFIENVLYWLVAAKSVFPGYDPANPATFPQAQDLVDNNTVKKINGHKDPAAAQLVFSIGSVDQ
jgi:hypothetical protein